MPSPFAGHLCKSRGSGVCFPCLLKNTHLHYTSKSKLETLLWKEGADGIWREAQNGAPDFSAQSLQLVYTCPECRQMNCVPAMHTKKGSALPFSEILRLFICDHFTRTPQGVYHDHLGNTRCPGCNAVELAPTDSAFFDHGCPQNRIQCHLGALPCGKMIGCGSHAELWDHLKTEHSWECPKCAVRFPQFSALGLHMRDAQPGAPSDAVDAAAARGKESSRRSGSAAQTHDRAD